MGERRKLPAFIRKVRLRLVFVQPSVSSVKQPIGKKAEIRPVYVCAIVVSENRLRHFGRMGRNRPYPKLCQNGISQAIKLDIHTAQERCYSLLENSLWNIDTAPQ